MSKESVRFLCTQTKEIVPAPVVGSEEIVRLPDTVNISVELVVPVPTLPDFLTFVPFVPIFSTMIPKLQFILRAQKTHLLSSQTA
jgi:hypothetical protein